MRFPVRLLVMAPSAGAFGDLQITVLDNDKVVTSYEMKNKAVQRADIDRALQKLAAQGRHVQNS